jgi:tRNA-uridine 2-sulfurtransferase
MKRVLVGMSGGVDSSVAAFLLKEKGFQVIGTTMRTWKEGEGSKSLYGCCGAEEVEDARHVAQQLGIPFYVFNLEEEFEREVIQYFCEEYARGRTPNPCIPCNEKIKFGSLLRRARELGADFFSTGHYARVEFDAATNRYSLRKGIDRKKDQSYVLYSLSQEQLGHSLFPLGEYRKEEVRQMALHLGLRVHDKPESQEICFIHDRSYHPFLRERLGERVEAGPFLDRKGSVLGEHKGIAFYTIGQRRGLGLARGKPLYVVAIDREKNAVVVGEESEVYRDTFIVQSVHWISGEKRSSPISARVKIRYNDPGGDATVIPESEERVRVQFRSPHKAITPGQAAVFYDGETVLGGGWIEESMQNAN